ncbi:MAG: YihY/virulence factor BrkB family protein [Mycoplasmatales bacterium]
MSLKKRINDNLVFKFILIFKKKFIYFDTFGIAAQVAYYFIFSIFPLLLLVISLLPLFEIDPFILTKEISTYLPEVLANSINNVITSLLIVSNGYIITASIVLTLWSGSAMTNSLIKSINRINDGRITRNYFFSRALSLIFTLGFLIIIIITIVTVPVGNKFISTYLPSRVQFIFEILNNLIIPLVFTLLLFGIYYFGPDNKGKIKHILPGTFTAIFGFFIFNIAFNYYIVNFSSYYVVYGTLGAIIVFLLWSYSIGLLIMVGALINSTIKDIVFFLHNEHPNTVMINYSDSEDFWNEDLEKALLKNQHKNKK